LRRQLRRIRTTEPLSRSNFGGHTQSVFPCRSMCRRWLAPISTSMVRLPHWLPTKTCPLQRQTKGPRPGFEEQEIDGSDNGCSSVTAPRTDPTIQTLVRRIAEPPKNIPMACSKKSSSASAITSGPTSVSTMIMSIVEPEFALFQMQIESVFGNAVELRQPLFGKAPEGFDSIDVCLLLANSFLPWLTLKYL